MTCANCGENATSLYAIPRPLSRWFNDPRAPQWCYDCWVQVYGSDEELADWINKQDIDKAIAADAFPNK